MPLDISKLDNVQKQPGKTIARCPACAQIGKDRKGIHLCIFPDGRYGCVAFQNDREHSREIFRLAGTNAAPRTPTAKTSFWRLAGIPDPNSDLEQFRFRTVRTGFSQLRGRDNPKTKLPLHKTSSFRKGTSEYPSGASEVEKWLMGKFELIEWDDRKARQIIRSLEPREESNVSTEACRRSAMKVAEKMTRKEFHFSARSPLGRITTSLTSLRRELRPCVTVGGERLYGIDLKNSQPLLVAILARIFFGSKEGRRRLLKAEKCDSALLRLCSGDVGEPQDVRSYRAAAERALIFELAGKNRNEGKLEIYKYLFGKNGCSRIGEVFASRWPMVGQMIWRLKEKDHRRMKQLLQSLESSIFIDRIAARLMDKAKDLPIFTAHDAILTLKDHVPTVERIIRREFRKLGIDPPLKAKLW